MMVTRVDGAVKMTGSGAAQDKGHRAVARAEESGHKCKEVLWSARSHGAD